MARQNIQFKGMRHNPSDITGQDGDLLECVNLIHENGELKPIEMPEITSISGTYSEEVEVEVEGETETETVTHLGVLVAVHNLTDGKKYVFAENITGEARIFVKKENNTLQIFTGHVNISGTLTPLNGMDYVPLEGEAVQWAETIGNTLIIGTDKSTHYALYKNGVYKWLGDKLPQPVFEFDFKRDSETHDGWTQDANGYVIESRQPNIQCYLSEDVEVPGGGLPLDLDPSYDRIFSINLQVTENRRILREWIREHIANVVQIAGSANVFIFPFLIRYAVRMFDGNYAMHSAPLLMLPSTIKALMAYLVSYSFNDDTVNDHIYYTSHPCVIFRGMELLLKFKGFVDDDGEATDVEDWDDIIKGVDIFLSSQIHSIDYNYLDREDGVPTTFYPYNLSDIPVADRPTYGIHDFGYCYSQNNKLSWYNIFNNAYNLESETATMEWNGNYWQIPKYYDIPLPYLSLNSMGEKIKDTNIFYRVKRYDLGELKVSLWNDYRRLSTEIETGLLNRLETLPTLPDDYVSRSRITGKVSYNYNQRLLLGNLKLQAPLWYQDAKEFNDALNTMPYITIYFVVEKQEKTIYIQWSKVAVGSVGLGNYDFGHYLYYPDPDCKKAIITLYHGAQYTIEVPMHEHTGLHGAYALMPDLQSLWEAYASFDTNSETITPSADRYYQMPNTIAMSSVANPFHFVAENFKDIGRTKVVGMAANTLDVSSGQWGQYPLYVFCSDGIVAVIIDGEGKFGGIQAVSADVLREPQGLSQPTLVQLGQALMFLTQRGVMMIAGTRINCVSEAMNGRHFNPLTALLPITPSPSVVYNVGLFADLITRTSDSTPFRDFVENGFLAYDYAHNRVLLLNASKDYQYVFSLNTGLWSKEIIYQTAYQIDVLPDDPSQRSGDVPLLDTVPIMASVNNYTEMYLQDEEGSLYKTMEVKEENANNLYYKFGYFISRPIRFGTDEYKTSVRLLHRYTHFANMSFVRMAVYGSRDGVKYGRINTLRGMSYQYYIFVIYTYLKPNERYSYMSVDFEPRLTNKLR